MTERMLFLDLETNLKGNCISKAGLCMESLDGGMAWLWEEARSGIALKTVGGVVALLSREGSRQFLKHSGRVEEIRVLGVYGWRKEDAEPEWRKTYAANR